VITTLKDVFFIANHLEHMLIGKLIFAIIDVLEMTAVLLQHMLMLKLIDV